ncbi:MAG: hypothetical protein AAB426_00905 [Myxococcota bacterium]
MIGPQAVTRAASLAALSVFAAPLAVRAEQAPAPLLEQGIYAYERGDYRSAVELLRAVRGRTEVSTQDRVRAMHFEAFSLWLDHRPDEARSVWLALLALSPDYRLDTDDTSPDLIAFFAPLRPLEDVRTDGASGPPRCAPWLCFAPFGVGQLVNREPTKGVLFALSQVAFLGLNIALYWRREALVAAPASTRSQADIDRMYLMQHATLALFAASALVGIIDANLSAPTGAL